MTLIIRDLIAEASQRLAEAGVEAPRLDAWLLLGHAAGLDRARLIVRAAEALPGGQEMAFRNLVARRAMREPVAHILGEREFWSLPFLVNPDVLCPRPESETLVETALATLKGRADQIGNDLRILDLGTGTGCLLLALLHELAAAGGIGVDRSERALAVAASNAHRLGLSSRAAWLVSDWGAALDGRFDVVVSNPPYIELGDRPNLAPEIRSFEPHQALFAGEDGLDAYRALAAELPRLLTPSGFACLELGHGQADRVTDLMTDAGLVTVAKEQDLAGIVRCLAVQRPKG